MKKLESIKNSYKKLQADIDEKKVESIGVLELRNVYIAKILKLQEDITRIKEEARYDINIDTEDLGSLFKKSEDLWSEMSETLSVLSDVLEGKENQIQECDAEIIRQKSIIDMYAAKIEVYTDMTREDEKMLANEELDPELQKLCSAELDAENKKLEKLAELIDKHKEVCFGLNETVSILRNGGVLKKAKAKGKDKEDEIDSAFANGLTKKTWDKAFVNGFEEDEEELPELPKEEDEALEDGDLAELVVPDLGDGPAKEGKEVIPVTVEETDEEEKPEEEELPELPKEEDEEVVEEAEEEVEELPELPVEEEPELPPAIEEVPVREAPAEEVKEDVVVPEVEPALPPELPREEIPMEETYNPEESDVLPPEIPTEGEAIDLESQSLETAMDGFDWDKYFEKTFDENGQTLK